MGYKLMVSVDHTTDYIIVESLYNEYYTDLSLFTLTEWEYFEKIIKVIQAAYIEMCSNCNDYCSINLEYYYAARYLIDLGYEDNSYVPRTITGLQFYEYLFNKVNMDLPVTTNKFKKILFENINELEKCYKIIMNDSDNE